jgi:hypothetical protein
MSIPSGVEGWQATPKSRDALEEIELEVLADDLEVGADLDEQRLLGELRFNVPAHGRL